MFVPRALPGEALTAKITVKKSGFARARKIDTVRPHDHIATPHCQHFGPCGGCTLQSLEYASQVAFKEHQIAALMQRVANIAPEHLSSIMKPIVPCEQPYEYRNKMEFSCDPVAQTLGLHLPGSNDRVLPITSCSIQASTANDILAEIQKLCKQHGIFPDLTNWDSTRRPPLCILQHVVIRHSALAENNFLINFVTSKDGQEVLTPVAAALRKKFGNALVGCVNSVSVKGRPTVERRIAKEIVLEGQGVLVERLCGLEYEVSPNGFFQVNSRQAEKLFALVLTGADLKPTDTVLDLYCGGGAITLMLAKKCKQVYGVEISSASVGDARRNALRNKIFNTKIFCSDANVDLPPALRASNVVVVDPARQGLSPSVVRSIRLTAARRLVYVSCNPSTQARDIAALCAASSSSEDYEKKEDDEEELGSGSDDSDDEKVQEGKPFRLVSVQPVDMYPQTTHVESVAVLERDPCMIDS